jgi:ADP-ribose pyrophosphatase YjhB (NUDIX family)
MHNEFLEEIKRLKTLADTGMLYAKNEYDRERYRELREMSFRLLGAVSSHSVEALKQHFPLATDYPTAKVDIRGLVFSSDEKILLVKEMADGKWSLPGGWADVGHSPKETVIKEIKEETGLEANVKRLLAVFDKKKHPHPPQPFYVYKMIFWCEATTTEIIKGFDVLDVNYFPINQLPELSEDRILISQLQVLYQRIIRDEAECLFD